MFFSIPTRSEQSQFYPAALSLEIAQIHAYWEDSLYAVNSFPKADEKNWRVLGMIEQIVEDRKLLGPGNDADKRVLVEASTTSLVAPDVTFFHLMKANRLFSISHRQFTEPRKRRSSLPGFCDSYSLR